MPLGRDLSLTHLSLPGHSDSQDFTLKHQTRTGGTAVAPGMPRSGSGEEPYIPGTLPASLCRLRGVCTIPVPSLSGGLSLISLHFAEVSLSLAEKGESD